MKAKKELYINLLKYFVENQIKLKYVTYIGFGEEFNLKLSEFKPICSIEILNLEIWKTKLKKFREFEGYKIKGWYGGEFTDTPASKSYLCKRTEEEIAIIKRMQNPCKECKLETCSVESCIAFKTLTQNIIK